MGALQTVRNIILGKPKEEVLKDLEMAKLMNDTPVFSQFGDNIYASDLVQNAIDVVATECSKLMPKHIRVDANGVRTMPKSSINRKFKVTPNPLMTTSNFLEKTIWLLYLNYNAFIYPMYEIYTDTQGVKRKKFIAFYPLNPTQVTFEQDPKRKMYIKMDFKQGQTFTIPYQDIIHLRKKYSVNDIMGGGSNGQPDNDALLTILETNNTIVQGIGKAVKSTLSIRGIVKINTILDDEDQKKERTKFEDALKTGESGLLPIDLKSEFTPVSMDPKMVDKDTIQLLENKIIRWFGPSEPIMNGKFNDEEYQAFYEKCLEPLIISMGQAFTKCLFSEREIDMGNEVVLYPKNMMYLSTDKRLAILKTAGEQGLLTNDQKLELLNYPPIGGEEGAMRTQSLNYINTTVATEYQMSKANAPTINVEGGTNNE